MKKTAFFRLTAVVMATLMLLSVVPASVFAATVANGLSQEETIYQNGLTPYDPLYSATNPLNDDDPFLIGHEAWIDRSNIKYGAPSTPTYVFSKWAANTSVVNTSMGAFDDVELICDTSKNVEDKQAKFDAQQKWYTSNDENKQWNLTVNESDADADGVAYNRYDAAYGKWGITFDRNVREVSWTPDKQFKPSAQTFLYFSIEQTDDSTMSLALKIRAPGGASRWYTVTDNNPHYTVDASANTGMEQKPVLQIVDGTSEPIMGATETVTGALTGCINMEEWLPMLVDAKYNFKTTNFTVEEVRVKCDGVASRLNYLYMGPPTGYTLLPQVNNWDKDLGSNDKVLYNGWQSGSLVEVVNAWNSDYSVIIDATDANLADKKGLNMADTAHPTEGDYSYKTVNGVDYIQVAIPVHRWYNVLNDARCMSLYVKSELMKGADYAAIKNNRAEAKLWEPTVSLWGNAQGSVGSNMNVGAGYAYRYDNEQIVSIFNDGYYLLDNSQYSTEGRELMVTAGFEFEKHNFFDMLRCTGTYSRMAKGKDDEFGVTDAMTGRIYISAIRVLVRKGDKVTISGTTMTGNPANINDGTSNNAGSGSQPLIDTENGPFINTDKAAAYGPYNFTSYYTIHDLMSRETAVLGDIFKSQENQNFNLRKTPTVPSDNSNVIKNSSGGNVSVPGNTVVVSPVTYTETDDIKSKWFFVCYDNHYGWVKWFKKDSADKATWYCNQISYRPAQKFMIDAKEYNNGSAQIALNQSEYTPEQATEIAKKAVEKYWRLSFAGFVNQEHMTGADFGGDRDTTTGTLWDDNRGAGEGQNAYETSGNLNARDVIGYRHDQTVTDGRFYTRISNDTDFVYGAGMRSPDYNNPDVSAADKLKKTDKVSMALKTDIDIKQSPDLNTTISNTKSTDSGYPVLYYDFYNNFFKGTRLSIALTVVNTADKGNDSPATEVYYLTQKPENKKDFVLCADPNGTCDHRVMSLANDDDAHTTHYSGYISLKALKGKTITKVSIFQAGGMALNMRRFEVWTNDKIFEEMINTPNDGNLGEHPGVADTDHQAALTVGGEIPVYDMVDVLGSAAMTTLKGYDRASNKGWQLELGGIDKTKFEYRYTTGNMLVEVPPVNGTADQRYLVMRSDRSYDVKTYKYLYYSFGVRDTDGVGYYPKPKDVAADSEVGIRMYVSSGMQNKAAEDQDATCSVLTNTGNFTTETGPGAWWTFNTSAMGCVDLSKQALRNPNDAGSGNQTINTFYFDVLNRTNQSKKIYINYLYLSNTPPTELYKTEIKKEVTQYIYMMDNTGSQYSTRFPTADNFTGVVRKDEQRVNPVKVSRGDLLQYGTTYSGAKLNELNREGSNVILTDDEAFEAIWFYEETNDRFGLSGETDYEIQDVYDYKAADGGMGTKQDLRWSYSRWPVTNNNYMQLDENNEIQGKLMEKFANENNVLLRAGIMPKMKTTYYNAKGGQMVYDQSETGTGLEINLNNYYITNTALFSYFTWPTTHSKDVTPQKLGYTFKGWKEEDNYDELHKYNMKLMPGDNYFEAQWEADADYNDPANDHTVTFHYPNGQDWVMEANNDNDYIVPIPCTYNPQNTNIWGERIVGWYLMKDGEADTSKLYTFGSLLMVPEDLEFQAVTAEDTDENTVSVTMTDKTKLWVYLASRHIWVDNLEDYDIVVDKESVSGMVVYSKIPYSIKLLATPAEIENPNEPDAEAAVQNGRWVWMHGGNDSDSFNIYDRNNAADLTVSSQTMYEFSAFADMKLDFVPGDAVEAPLVWSSPYVPCQYNKAAGQLNREMKFYAQVDVEWLQDMGYTLINSGTLYTKNGQIEKIDDRLEELMQLDPATLSKEQYATKTSSVRNIVASKDKNPESQNPFGMSNPYGQYCLSVTENKGVAVTYYTRAYFVYTDANDDYKVAYSDIVAVQSLDEVSTDTLAA